MIVREYAEPDLPEMCHLWNEIVTDGNAFPQEEPLDDVTARLFFASQSHSGVAVDEEGNLCGLYILHPNNIGRCGHIANASYAVSAAHRGRRIGEALVKDSIAQAARLGFTILQFNAVVESNTPARRLYEKLGFHQLGVITGGFRNKEGQFENICPYFIEVSKRAKD